MKLVTPHLRRRRGTGSRSRFVQRAFPSAKADLGCVTWMLGSSNFMVAMAGRNN